MIGGPAIRVKSGLLAVRLRNPSPQLLGTAPAAITNVKSDHLLGPGVECNPDPLLVGFLPDKTPRFVSFGF